MFHRWALRSLLCLLLLSALPAAALTYVDMEDGVLADASALIVEVEVVDMAVVSEGGVPSTDYQVNVRQVFKGEAPGSTLVVRVLGGTVNEGLSLQVQGAPRFRAGESALLFLKPRPDGAFGLTQFTLGAFHLVRVGGESFAVRDLREAQAVDRRGKLTSHPERLRKAGRFKEWLAARAAGIERLQDYFAEVPASTFNSVQDGFTLFQAAGLNLRWPDFDAGQPVTYFAHQDGQPGLTGGGFAEFQSGLSAWTNDPSTNINYQYGGTTTLTGGLTRPCDDSVADDNDCTIDLLVNTLIFDDPNNNTGFGGAFNCATGGVIAIGGTWFDTSLTHIYQGVPFVTILAGDIITNKNTGCFLSANNAAREVFGHELGHTLGLGHSCDNQLDCAAKGAAADAALMRAFAHGDGRGAQLGTDDRAAIAFLYTPITGGGTCVADEFTLCLNNDRFEVQVDWTRPTGEQGRGHAIELTGDTGYFWFFNSANVEMVLKVLNACTNPANPGYWVFAGGLTNVEVEITVTDTEDGAVKTYTNPLRTPFQPIQDTSAFSTCP